METENGNGKELSEFNVKCFGKIVTSFPEIIT